MAGVSLLQEETLFILLHIYCHLDTSPTLYNAAATFTRCLVVAIAKPPCLVFGSWHIAHLRVDTGDIDRYPGDSPHGQASMPCFLDRRAAALLARPGLHARTPSPTARRRTNRVPGIGTSKHAASWWPPPTGQSYPGGRAADTRAIVRRPSFPVLRDEPIARC